MQFSLSYKKIALHNNKHFMANSKAYFCFRKQQNCFCHFSAANRWKKRKKTSQKRREKETINREGKK